MRGRRLSVREVRRLKAHPLTIQVKGNRLIAAHSANKELKDDFWAYTHKDENSDRVGEFAIGTNIELKDVIGEICRMRNTRACTLPSAIRTAAHRGRVVFVDAHRCGGRKFDIWVDGEQIMRDGHF